MIIVFIYYISKDLKMSIEIEELIISEYDTIDKVIEYIKILLNKSEKIRLIAYRKYSVISAKLQKN